MYQTENLLESDNTDTERKIMIKKKIGGVKL